MLDESQRWEAVLSDGEQQCLAFARALLHAPAWLIIDEALEALEADALPRVIGISSPRISSAPGSFTSAAQARTMLYSGV